LRAENLPVNAGGTEAFVVKICKSKIDDLRAGFFVEKGAVLSPESFAETMV